MNTSEYIIAAVDFSDSSAEALREALRISTDRGAQLTVVHVVDSRVMDGLCERIKIDVGAMLAETEKRLHEFIARTIASDAQLVAKVLHGHPFDELLRVVRDFGASLLVMGSHGSGDDPLRVGMIASKCIRKAPVDVLLVRELHQGRKFRKVLACVDFSENSKRAARRALEFARRDGAPVEFLHVYQPLSDRAPMADYFGISAELVTDEEMVEGKLADLKKFAAGLLADFPEVAHSALVIRCAAAARGDRRSRLRPGLRPAHPGHARPHRAQGSPPRDDRREGHPLRRLLDPGGQARGFPLRPRLAKHPC